MKAYWVVRGHILDIEEYSKYIELAGPIIKKYQGIFLARGGRQVELEGSGYGSFELRAVYRELG